MIELLNWIADHWTGFFISLWLLYCWVEGLIKACKTKNKS